MGKKRARMKAQERIPKGSVLRLTWNLYKTFAPHLKRYWLWFVGAYVCMASTIFLKVVTPYPLKWILDYVLLRKPLPQDRIGEMVSGFAGDAQGLLGLLCVSMVVLVFFEGLLSYTHRYMVASASQRANNDIRKHVFNRLQMLSLSFHDTIKPGDLVVRLTDDMTSLRRLLMNSMPTFVKMIFTIGWIIVLMAAIDWQLTLLALVVAPPIYVAAILFSRKVENLARVKRTKESAVGSLVQENVNSMAVVQAFSQEGQEGERFAKESNESLRVDLTRFRLERGFSRVMELLVAAGGAVVVYYAGTRALAGHLEATHLVLFVPWLKELYDPIRKFAALLMDVTRELVSGERIAELLQTEIRVKDADDAVPAPPFRGQVAFDHVTFGYRKDVPVLKDLTFQVRPGQMVALVGTSGAGKSTMVNLLLRFFDPWQGTVRIDDTDIRRFKMESVRSQISVVLQDALLFRRSIRENIAYGRPDASMEDVVRAAKAAQIHDFVETLPDKYDTVLGEESNNLSGGQKQRVSLARAILRDTPILILDEPVSQLDAITAARFEQAVAHAMTGRTTFVIAHRLSTIRRADLILVIEEGKVAEQGTHAQLMAASTLYRKLYETQYARVEPVQRKRRSA
jgi:ABC-type multidrug transport system fused ATPase/permease subunit